MKNKLNKTVLFATLVLLCGIGITSCRGGSAKKAAQLVEKYGGKLINGAKKAEIHKYGDDVIRHIEIKTVICSQCGGSGYYYGYTCDECDGEGKQYKIEYKD